MWPLFHSFITDIAAKAKDKLSGDMIPDWNGFRWHIRCKSKGHIANMSNTFMNTFRNEWEKIKKNPLINVESQVYCTKWVFMVFPSCHGKHGTGIAQASYRYYKQV